jgi:hypothetical protein
MIAGQGNGQLTTDERLKMKFNSHHTAVSYLISCQYCNGLVVAETYSSNTIAVSHGSLLFSTIKYISLDDIRFVINQHFLNLLS